MPVDAKRLQSVFLAAVEVADPALRAALLDRECGGDAEFRQRVAKLLAAHDDSAELPPAAGTADYQPPPGLTLGSIFAGRFKLRELIGEGGMGVVYVADQTEPVQRRVALKVIRCGADSSRMLARFEQERQALAVMDHPNIAKVYDAGIASEPGALAPGVPYFVMELIKGVPITTYCDEAKLSPRERLELFVPVCQAVQHAHQKGIIHRDLKPSNILVGLYDGKPVPKVIDFGVAKATGPRLSEHTVYTEVGSIIGTIEYMSPEQAELNNLDIDTRSDIYALGVILYELLTGSVPFSRKELQASGFAEMLRIIKEKEPPKPSTRLSQSGELPSVAAQRQTEPAKLPKLVRGDLDWITMKALEKDRTRRYETANGLAMDIKRFLAGEDVLAAPPSAIYRMKKFVRRNKGGVIAASLIAVALVAGLAATMWQSHQKEIARLEAVAAADREADTRKRAERAEDETIASYRASTDDAIEQLIGSKAELGPKEKTYLENTLKRWQAFAGRTGNDERSQAIRAEGHMRVGELWQQFDRQEEARREYETALDLLKKLAEAFPEVPKYQEYLAISHTNLGSALAHLGEREKARREYESARDLVKILAEAYPNEPVYQHKLAAAHGNLGHLMASMGLLTEARPEDETARDLLKKLVNAFPNVSEYQKDLAQSYDNLAGRLFNLGLREEARRQYETARDLRTKLADQFPADHKYQRDLAHTHSNLGFVLATLDRREAARRDYEIALAMQKKLAIAFPAVLRFQHELAHTHGNFGLLLASMGRAKEARREYESARDVQKKLADDFPTVPEYQVQLGGTYCNLGNLGLDNDTEESLRWYDLAIRTLSPMHKAERRDVLARTYLRNSHAGRAVANDQLKRIADAENDWGRAVELSPPAEQPKYRAGRAYSWAAAGKLNEAFAEFAELTQGGSWTAAQWYDFACVYAVASGRLADKKQEYADIGVELLRKAVAAGYKNVAHMKKDTDLDALRERDDYKKLIAELEAKAATEKKP